MVILMMEPLKENFNQEEFKDDCSFCLRVIMHFVISFM